MKEDIKQIRIDGAGEEIVMLEGTLIAESPRVGTTLADLNLTVRKSVGTGPVGPRRTRLVCELPAAGGELYRLPRQDLPLPRGDAAGRAAAQAYGRQLAIPDPQLDWTV